MEKVKRRIEKYPELGRIFAPKIFGENRNEKKIEIDLYAETQRKLENMEKDLEKFNELENNTWKLWFAERFFERIAYLNTKEKTHNETLFKFSHDLLERKKRREITALEKVVNLFT